MKMLVSFDTNFIGYYGAFWYDLGFGNMPDGVRAVPRQVPQW